MTARAADAFHALVICEGVTVLSQTPSAFRAFDAADVAAGRPANQLRHVVFGGEALNPRCLKHWFESHGDERPRVANMYGITETTVHVTYRRMLAKDADGSGKSLIGAPLADLDARLERSGQGRGASPHRAGRSFIHDHRAVGPTVSKSALERARCGARSDASPRAALSSNSRRWCSFAKAETQILQRFPFTSCGDSSWSSFFFNSASPRSAALRYQAIACALSCGTPRPLSYARPRLY